MLDMLEHHMALLHQVEETARRRDQDIHAAAQLGDLCVLGDAAEDDGVAQVQILAVGVDLVADLDRQFAGRRQDKRAGMTAFAVAMAARQDVQERQRERAGLAGAGLGDAQEVDVFEKPGDRPGLDRRGRFVVAVMQCPQDRIGQAEIRERNVFHVMVLVRLGPGRTCDSVRARRFVVTGRGRLDRISWRSFSRYAPIWFGASRNREITDDRYIGLCR